MTVKPELQNRNQKMHTYDCYKGKRRVATVKATELSDAAEKVEPYWPCNLQSPHLPYSRVDIEPDGTLSPVRHGSKPIPQISVS